MNLHQSALLQNEKFQLDHIERERDDEITVYLRPPHDRFRLAIVRTGRCTLSALLPFLTSHPSQEHVAFAQTWQPVMTFWPISGLRPNQLPADEIAEQIIKDLPTNLKIQYFETKAGDKDAFLRILDALAATLAPRNGTFNMTVEASFRPDHFNCKLVDIQSHAAEKRTVWPSRMKPCPEGERMARTIEAILNILARRFQPLGWINYPTHQPGKTLQIRYPLVIKCPENLPATLKMEAEKSLIDGLREAASWISAHKRKGLSLPRNSIKHLRENEIFQISL